MNKKLILPTIILILIIPTVLAQAFLDGMNGLVGNLFNKSEDIALIALFIWVIAFVLIYKALEKTFKENEKIALISALLLSIISIYFMPEEYIENLGIFYQWILIGIAFLAPFIIGHQIAKKAKMEKKGKLFLIAFLYAIVIFAFMYAAENDISGIFLDYEIFNTVPWLPWALGALLVWMLVKWLFKGAQPFQKK